VLSSLVGCSLQVLIHRSGGDNDDENLLLHCQKSVAGGNLGASFTQAPLSSFSFRCTYHIPPCRDSHVSYTAQSLPASRQPSLPARQHKVACITCNLPAANSTQPSTPDLMLICRDSHFRNSDARPASRCTTYVQAHLFDEGLFALT